MDELSGKPYYVSDIQDYFECILKKHETNANNPSIKIYVNKLEKRITIKLKRGYYPDLLTPESMKLFRSTKSKITKDKNNEILPHLEITEVVLIQCNILNKTYQQDLRVLYTFVPDKLFGQLLDISPQNF